MGFTSNKEELKHRFESKRKELEAEIERLKADSSKQARESSDQLSDKLAKLQDAVKGGWDDLTEEAASKINALLEDG